jgi:two-component system, OmpR family, KDP operon response regulator KdpE
MSSPDLPQVLPLVLVIEDEPQVRRFLRTTLPAQGYRVVEASSAEQGLLEAAARRPDLVILDLGLPDLDGAQVIERLREWTQVPIVVVSVRGREMDKVQALEAGADDYLTKPFGMDELLARMKVAMRHAIARERGTTDPVVEIGQLRVDLASRRVFVRDKEVRLTRTEYQLLALLVRHAGKVVTHRQLLTEVWGPEAGGQTGYVRVYMGHLRHKLEDEPANPRYLLTEMGVGYRLAAE